MIYFLIKNNSQLCNIYQQKCYYLAKISPGTTKDHFLHEHFKNFNKTRPCGFIINISFGKNIPFSLCFLLPLLRPKVTQRFCFHFRIFCVSVCVYIFANVINLLALQPVIFMRTDFLYVLSTLYRMPHSFRFFFRIMFKALLVFQS